MIDCLHPYYQKETGLQFPCGQCHICLRKRKFEWITRITHHLDAFPSGSSFVTLTYDEDHIPDFRSLKKSDYQNFIKRMRSGDISFDYFVTGEYGPQTQRPHYHLIMFGLSLGFLDLYVNRLLSKPNDIKMSSRVIDKFWTLGHNVVGVCNQKSVAYVAGYVQKKLFGEECQEVYDKTNRVRPFSHCSKGIGLDYALKNADRIRKELQIRSGKYMVPVPRYYRKKLDIKGEEYEDSIREGELKKMKEYYEDTGKSPELKPKDDREMLKLYSQRFQSYIYSMSLLVYLTSDFLRWHYIHVYQKMVNIKRKVEMRRSIL